MERRLFHPPGGFLAAVLPLLVAGDFAAAAPAVLAPLAADGAPLGFFSPTLVLDAGVPAEPVEVLVAAEVGVLLLFLAAAAAAGGAFLGGTPLVGGLDVPLDMRLWAVLGRDPAAVLPGAGADLATVPMLGLDLSRTLLDGLALRSAEILLLILAAAVSLVWSGWAGPGPAGCCCCCPSTVPVACSGSWTLAASGSAWFSGLDSSVSTGSRAAVTTPSGFISPQ